MLSENIKKYREKRNWSLVDLANEIYNRTNKKFNTSTLKRYETGEIKNIPYDTVIVLAEIFSVSPTRLMGWEEAPVKEEFILTEAEKEHVKKYRQLSPEGKLTVDNFIAFTIFQEIEEVKKECQKYG